MPRQVELDDAIQSVGGFGLFQRVMMFLLCPAAMFQGAHMTANFFLLYSQDHRCKIPWDDNDTSYIVHGYEQLVRKNMSIPEGDSCSVYDPTKLYEYDMYNRPINASTVPCPQGYVFDKSDMVFTATEEFKFVCDDLIYISHTNLLLYLGSLLGSTVLGYVADKFGRKKCFLLCVLLLLATGTAMSWSPDFAALGVFQFLAGAATTGMSANAFVMGLELVEPKSRKVPALFYMACFSLGEIVTGAVSYGLRNWKWIELVITLPAVWFLSYIWLVPESIRWLMLHKKRDEVAEILQKISRWNKRPLPAQAEDKDEMQRLLESYNADDQVAIAPPKPTDSILHLFKYKVLAQRATVVFINWLLIMTIFYGFVFNSDNLTASDVFLNFALGAVVELPAHFTTLCLIDKIGRKAMHVSFLVLALLASAAAIGVIYKADEDAQWVVLMLSCIGKFGAAGLTGTSFLWTTELFPTSLRSTGLGLSNSFGRVGALVTTAYIMHETSQMHSKTGQAIPFIVFGVAAIITILLVLVLPETLNKRLPDNIQEARFFGINTEGAPPPTAEPSVLDEDGDQAVKGRYGSQGYTVNGATFGV